MPDYVIRNATTEDLPLVREAIVRAMQWNPQRQLPPPEHLLAWPELARYHVDWGRAGDIGVVAVDAVAPIGMAFCRLFTDGDHGEGYVDAATPEMVIGVSAGHRNAGVGGRMIEALSERARAGGVARLSLSVDAANPAVHLYRRLGFELLRQDEHGLLMLKPL